MFHKITGTCMIAISVTIMVFSYSLGIAQSNDDQYWSDEFYISGLDNYDEGFALTEYNGNLIVGGSFEHADGIKAHNVAGWDGTNWFPLGNGLDTSAFVLTVYNGLLFAGVKNSLRAGSL